MKNDMVNRLGSGIIAVRRVCLSAVLIIAGCLCSAAQQNGAMRYGENVVYDVYFKWGLILSRAGEATFSYDRNYSVERASSRYQLLFKTAKFFDNFFKMRDTIQNYYNNKQLIYSKKASDEGGYYLIDELTFYHEKENTSIHSFRYTPSRVKIDTMLSVSGEAIDMLGFIYCLRGIDRSKLKKGDTRHLVIAIGRDLIKVQLCYQNKEIISHGSVKYNTLYFKINIEDKAFESANASAEVWIGDDDNCLPIKVRSKLKIGYAEVYFKQASNPANPLSCKIEKRN